MGRLDSFMAMAPKQLFFVFLAGPDLSVDQVILERTEIHLPPKSQCMCHHAWLVFVFP